MYGLLFIEIEFHIPPDEKANIAKTARIAANTEGARYLREGPTTKRTENYISRSPALFHSRTLGHSPDPTRVYVHIFLFDPSPVRSIRDHPSQTG